MVSRRLDSHADGCDGKSQPQLSADNSEFSGPKNFVCQSFPKPGRSFSLRKNDRVTRSEGSFSWNLVPRCCSRSNRDGLIGNNARFRCVVLSGLFIGVTAFALVIGFGYAVRKRNRLPVSITVIVTAAAHTKLHL